MMRILLLGIIIAASSSFCGGRGGSLFPTVGASSASAASSSSSSSSSSLWRQQQLAHLHHHHHHHHHHQHQLPISQLLYRRSNYSISNNDNNNNSDLVYSLKSLRGGAAAAAAALLQDDDDDYIDESDIDLLDIEQHQQGDEDNDTEEDDDDDDDDAPSTTTTTTTNANTLPIKIHITTGLNSPLLDQHIEFTASPKRSLHSIKQAISKTMPGRPPISCIQLRHRGRLLERGYDDSSTMTVNDILSLDDDDDDDDIEDNNNNEEDDDDEDDEDSIKLSLTCDILPPIDSKFGIEFRNKIVSLSTKEIIEAYCLNMAGMMYGQEEQCLSTSSSLEGKNEDDDDEENNNAPTATITPATATIGKDNPSLNIRKRAAFLQKQLFDTMFTEETKQLIEEEHARVMKKKMMNNNVDGGGRDEQEVAASGQEDEGEVVFGLISPTSRSNAHRSGGRKGGGSKGGATMNVKKALQKNLNVNWADTTRNALLFLFFGYFGGRNSFSRAFLLLSSPLCFFIQTRPVKVAMKQLFYTIGEPPGILLSLLPAPQQAIMSCDYGKLMKGLYGEKMLEGEEWLEMERLEAAVATVKEENERSGSGCGYSDEEDDEYDHYDDEPDSDGDY